MDKRNIKRNKSECVSYLKINFVTSCTTTSHRKKTLGRLNITKAITHTEQETFHKQSTTGHPNRCTLRRIIDGAPHVIESKVILDHSTPKLKVQRTIIEYYHRFL